MRTFRRANLHMSYAILLSSSVICILMEFFCCSSICSTSSVALPFMKAASPLDAPVMATIRNSSLRHACILALKISGSWSRYAFSLSRTLCRFKFIMIASSEPLSTNKTSETVLQENQNFSLELKLKNKAAFVLSFLL